VANDILAPFRALKDDPLIDFRADYGAGGRSPMNSQRFEKKFVGGKGQQGVFHRIINQIPPCRVLIEPFAGEAVIARTIRQPEVVILVDRVRQPGLVLSSFRPSANFHLGDGIAFLDGYRYTGKEFVYADPPYLLRARAARGREYYESEMTDAEHGRFLRVAKAINCRVMISGYHSPLYDDALSDWRLIEFEAMTRGGKKALECLWLNYPAPVTLQDYRFLGGTWRERWNLKRKIRRAVADMLSMPTLQRAAFFDAMQGAMRSPGPEMARPTIAAAAATGNGAVELERRRPAPIPAPLQEIQNVTARAGISAPASRAKSVTPRREPSRPESQAFFPRFNGGSSGWLSCPERR
jgi:DNA adenine methylase